MQPVPAFHYPPGPGPQRSRQLHRLVGADPIRCMAKAALRLAQRRSPESRKDRFWCSTTYITTIKLRSALFLTKSVGKQACFSTARSVRSLLSNLTAERLASLSSTTAKWHSNITLLRRPRSPRVLHRLI